MTPEQRMHFTRRVDAFQQAVRDATKAHYRKGTTPEAQEALRTDVQLKRSLLMHDIEGLTGRKS